VKLRFAWKFCCCSVSWFRDPSVDNKKTKKEHEMKQNTIVYFVVFHLVENVVDVKR